MNKFAQAFLIAYQLQRAVCDRRLLSQLPLSKSLVDALDLDPTSDQQTGDWAKAQDVKLVSACRAGVEGISSKAFA